MNILGTLHVKKETQVVSEKFAKREFVLLDNSSQYPQYILFQLTQDRCDFLDTINIGTEIDVYFNLRGREWTSKEGEVKYFTGLEAWKIKVNSEGIDVPHQEQNPDTFVQGVNDNLPF